MTPEHYPGASSPGQEEKTPVTLETTVAVPTLCEPDRTIPAPAEEAHRESSSSGGFPEVTRTVAKTRCAQGCPLQGPSRCPLQLPVPPEGQAGPDAWCHQRGLEPGPRALAKENYSRQRRWLRPAARKQWGGPQGDTGLFTGAGGADGGRAWWQAPGGVWGLASDHQPWQGSQTSS